MAIILTVRSTNCVVWLKTVSLNVTSAFTSAISLSSLCPLFILNLFKIPEQSSAPIKDNNGHGYEIDPKILNKINDNIDIVDLSAYNFLYGD